MPYPNDEPTTAGTSQGRRQLGSVFERTLISLQNFLAAPTLGNQDLTSTTV
jgi:hypothetical protein